jgi:two-component system chemotaxis response regulator CheY
MQAKTPAPTGHRRMRGRPAETPVPQGGGVAANDCGVLPGCFSVGKQRLGGPMAAILIVDDSSGVRTVIQRILETSGFHLECCYQAGDGEEGLAILRRHHVDLVISDVNMPRLGGEAMLRKMKEDEVLEKIPVVMISSDATQFRIDRLLEFGASAHVAKPFNVQAFREQVERLLVVCDV